METVLKAISDWIKSLLTAAIMSNLNGLFDDVNTQVGSIAQQVGTKPSSFEPRVFAMIEALSRNVVLPIAGVILTFIACYELIQMITEHNNMAQFEPALILKWIHNYFFAKAIDQVRPGGIVAFVTSRYTMDSKDSTARKHMAERADLLGAIRLPNNAFRANAGTDVVSDIIFLQKRDRPADIEPAWVQLGKTEDGFAINQYFVDHPEMVLGVLSTESTQYGREELTVAPLEGISLADQLAEAVQHIEGQYAEVEVETPDIADVENEKHIFPADPEVKNFSYTVVDGEVFYRENSVMTQVELSDTAKGRVTGMVELRQIVNDLIDQQLNDYPDEDIKATQEHLNAAYDAFTAKYGLLNDRKNGRLFEQDSSYYLLCSLENLDEQGQLKSKAAMFTKRTIRPESTVTSVDTPSEALAVSIGEHGKVDLPYMAELLGTPDEYGRITTELSGVIFKDPAADPTDPEAGWQTADEYLSGNVRDKLRMAQLAAESHPEFKVNVDALTKAQPKDLEASEIDVRLGATWLDPSIVQQFMINSCEKRDSADAVVVRNAIVPLGKDSKCH